MVDLYNKEVIAPGDRASKLAARICFQSHKNCPAVFVVPHEPDNFRGPVGFVWRKEILQEMMEYQQGYLNTQVVDWQVLEEVENDGAGGKPQFFALVGTEKVFWNLGWEIITMTADDFARSGRFPAVIDNEIQIKYINEDNFHLFAAMMNGYGQALKQAGLVNITGEIAVMKHSITAFCDDGGESQLILTWGASCIGLARRELLFDSSRIQPGMVIVGFLEDGYRCNGGTFFSNLTIKKWGPEPKSILSSPEAIKFAEKLTIPSRSYARCVCRLAGWRYGGTSGNCIVNIVGVAHITGGGVWEKFGEILPAGVGADFHDMPKPPEVLLAAQKLSWDFPNLYLTDYQAYSTFHGGCGMMLVVENEVEARRLIAEAKIDGIRAQIIGHTVADKKNTIKIKSKFLQGKELFSDKLE